MKKSSRLHEFRRGHHVELIMGGEPYFTKIEKLIDEAKKYIHFQTYIIDEDETGLRIINALIRAARRGVRTYLLLDAYGTKYLSDEFINSIDESGIIFRFFSPTFTTDGFHLNLRLHHKIVLVDGQTAVIGGMNIADRYRGNGKAKPWLDFAVLLKGPECAYALGIVRKIWNKTFISKNERSGEVVYVPDYYDDDVHVRVLQNNWYRNKIEILRSYRWALLHAQKRMVIFASYFLPGRNERKLFKNASLRGVDITIVFAAESDAPAFKRATNFLYDFILRNNIKIYEYLPSNLHAKVATVDGRWSTIGSYNLNHLSDYGSIEMNVDILDESFAENFEGLLRNIIKNDCRQVTLEEYTKRRTLFTKVTGWLLYQMIRLMMRVLFFLTTKKEKRQASN